MTDFATATNLVSGSREDILMAQSQVRMLISYVQLHISEDTITGPNGGEAAPDIVNQCHALLGLLDGASKKLDRVGCV